MILGWPEPVKAHLIFKDGKLIEDRQIHINLSKVQFINIQYFAINFYQNIYTSTESQDLRREIQLLHKQQDAHFSYAFLGMRGNNSFHMQ